MNVITNSDGTQTVSGAALNFGGTVSFGNVTASTFSSTVGQSILTTGQTFTDTGAGGTRALWGCVSLGATTVAATNAVTITDAATLLINAQPTAGSNVTMTNKWAIWVAAGHVSLSATSMLKLNSGANIVFGSSTGSKIGTATSEKIGFWNATPVVQQVLATGSTTDQVITFLQTLGLCRQS